jgi:CHASE2 domain-containing sensor protein/signal transduction histidine kinase
VADIATDEASAVRSVFPTRSRLILEWLGLTIAASALVAALLLTGATARLDNGIYDFALRLQQRPVSADIVIVGFDDQTLRRQGEWPWPRQVHASILSKIARDKPRSIIFEVLLAMKGSALGDEALLKVMRVAPIFLPELLDERGPGEGGYLTRPTAEFAAAAAGLGRSNPTPDSDGIVRRAVLLSQVQGKPLPHVTVSAAGHRTLTRILRENPPRTHPHGAMPAPDEAFIPYAGPPGRYAHVSALDVIDDKVAPGFFRDKFVLVGGTAPGLLDNYPTPLSGVTGMPNVEIDANILDAVLRGLLIRAAPIPAQLTLSLGLLWVFCYGILRLKPRQLIIQGFLGALVCLGGSVAGILWLRVWLPPTPVLITGTLLQVVWASRRLQAASDYLARELSDLQSRAGGAVVPGMERSGPIIGDSVSRQMILIDETRDRIRALRRFVNDVLANFPDPVMVVSPRGRILTFNQAATLLGRRLGHTVEIGAQIQPLLEDLETAAGDGRRLWPPLLVPGEETPRGVGPGGRILEARYTITGDNDGEPRGWTIQLVDVTELVSAMRQREEALKLFTHDMRAPQSAILAALDHKEFQSVPAALREGIQRNALRTLSLADGWVRLAQAESTDYTFEPIDLFHTLSDATDALWSIAQAASIEVVTHDPGREYVVSADRGLLSRALINLIDNAIKASSPGKSVTCTLGPTQLHGRPAVALTVADKAYGMSRDQRANLFKRFARTTTHGADGRSRPVRFDSVGLGLAVVHTVVTRHNGHIDCESEVDIGTTFTISLPLYEDEEGADEFSDASQVSRQ